MGLPLLDESKLQQLLDLDEGNTLLLGEMAALFKAETPRRLAAIRTGLETGNASVVMEAAHALKGASGLMGAQIVFALARELEMKAKAGDLPSGEVAFEAWTRLDEAVLKAQEAIDYFLSKITP
ncbi:MAG: Hpt domain-containing protein [Holophagaceae bacterium]|nr:Hpt domain-containing protein [Holophagaceae bacterium]